MAKQHLLKSFPDFLRNLKKMIFIFIFCFVFVFWILKGLENQSHCFFKQTGNTLFCTCRVAWGCRIHKLLHYRGVRPPPHEWAGYDTKQSVGEVPVMLELWGMQSTPSLSLLPSSLWPGVVAPDRVLSIGQIELNCVALDWTVLTFKLRIYAELNCLKWNCFYI